MKPNSNQETAVGGGGECSGGAQEALQEGINWNILSPILKPPCSRPRPFMGSPKHGHPQLPWHHPASLLSFKKLLNIDFYNVCFADDVSPEYHEITGFSYKVLMHV